MMKQLKDNNGGIALIFALFLLVIIATFIAVLTSKTRVALMQANNFKHASKSYCLARAGLHRALYELKFHPTSGHAACAGANINAYDAQNEAWYFNYGNDINVNLIDANNASFGGLYSSRSDITEDVDGKSSFKLKIVDAASLININMADTTGLHALLLNLREGALSAGEVSDIISSRPTNGYKRISDIKEFVNENTYTVVQPYLTVHSFMDAKLIKQLSGKNRFASISSIPADGELRAPININTADYEVLRTVFRGLASAISNTEADELAQRIRARTNTNPFTSWREFNNFIESVQGSLFSNPENDGDIIKRAVNPNRAKPSAYTTDLCFASEGYFEIHSLGQVTNSLGVVIASREFKIDTKIYDIMRFSTRDDFIGRPDGITNVIIDDDGDGAPNILDTSLNNPSDIQSFVGNHLKPGFRNTTWYDSTPIDPDDDLGFKYRDDYTVIPGSIKLGFWDNFDESPEESDLIWRTNQAGDNAQDHMVDVGLTSYWNSTSSTMPAMDRNDNELWHHFDDDPSDDLFVYNNIPVPSPFAQTEGNDDDFVAFRLGQFYNRWEPASMTINTYRRWGYNMYLRVFNSEGPRTIATHIGITPGIIGTDFPGRDYQDVGYIAFRCDESRNPPERRFSLFGLSTLGNYYTYETRYPDYDMDGNGENLDDIQAIRNVSAVYPPELFFPDPPAAQIVDASAEPYAFANDPQPPDPPIPNALNYTNRLNSLFMLKSNPWNIPWFWEGTEMFPAFPLSSISAPLRDKTYRIISKGDDALLQMSYEGLSNYAYVTMFNENGLLPHQSGSVALYGKASHPAWDDLRIIGNVGEYTTAAFKPGSINANNNDILWGTFAWTETLDSNAASTPRLNLRLLFAEGDPPAENDRYGYSIAFNNQGTGGPLISGTHPMQAPYAYVRIYANMGVSDICPDNDKAPDIPILEDATITYLPETVIYYVQEN